MTFIDFLRNFEGDPARGNGFLRHALEDRNFPDIQSWDNLNVYLILHRADAETREAAQWFWEAWKTARS